MSYGGVDTHRHLVFSRIINNPMAHADLRISIEEVYNGIYNVDNKFDCIYTLVYI
jgi:hypothetical protein